MTPTSRSASAPSLLRLRSVLLAGLAVAAVGAAAPVVATSVLPATTATAIDPVQDQDLLTPAGSLATTLTDPARRQTVVDQLAAVSRNTAENEGGVTMRVFDSAGGDDAARTLMNRQLVGYANALQPQWDAYRASGGSGTFGDYLAARAPEVSAELLGVSDRFAAAADSVGARVAYRLARPGAEDAIAASLPETGTVIENAMR